MLILAEVLLRAKLKGYTHLMCVACTDCAQSQHLHMYVVSYSVCTGYVCTLPD